MDWTVIIFLVTAVVIVTSQYYFGYYEKKLFGWIYPVVFIVLVSWFAFEGLLEFSLRDILIPLIFLATLASIWDRGYTKNRKKNKKN